MFLRIATSFFKQPFLKSQMKKSFMLAPMSSILTNHRLLIQNISYLQIQFYQKEESNDELELLQEEVPVGRMQ